MKPKKARVFDAQTFLDSTGVARKIVQYRKKDKIYSQGEACESVMYVQKRQRKALRRLHIW